MKTLFVDVLCGASGDMLLSALIDCGLTIDFLRNQFGRLKIPGFTIDTTTEQRSGITCRKLQLTWDTPKEYRHIEEILALINTGNYPQPVFDNCKKILMHLGAAEAAVHNVPLDHVHFHEIGAIDTIVDILGFCLGIDHLKIDTVEFSTLTDGHGFVKAEHGTMPVPVPAVAAMLKGFSIKTIDIETELLTPTGCAILTAIGTQKTGVSGTILSTGYGCGTKKFDHVPNCIRIFITENTTDTTSTNVTMLETDMDHISGEIMGHTAELLLQSGALDVSWTPVFMKKGRPAYRLNVLCLNHHIEKFADMIIANTHTLGIRVSTVNRIIVPRTKTSASWLSHQITEKNCSYKNITFTKIEYESLNALARESGRPLIELTEEYIKQKTSR